MKRRRYYTVAHANRALPYVSRIARDLAACYKRVVDLRWRVENPQEEDAPEVIRKHYENQMTALGGFVEELHEIGVEVKDFERGMVDFYAKHEGRDIYLCWKLGEPHIVAWHELDAGFAGRQDMAILTPKSVEPIVERESQST